MVKEKSEYSLEEDLKASAWIKEKVQASDYYAQNLYSALCNNEFIKADAWTILKDQRWSCSWRYSGGIIAEIKGSGDYMNYYCSGIRNVDYDEQINQQWDQKKYVEEGVVTEEIKEDLKKLGWLVATNPFEKT